MPKRICSVEGCEKPATSRGWCKAHHQRVLRYGDPRADKPLRPSPGTQTGCVVAGCDRPHKSLGLCALHYTVHWWEQRTPDGEYMARRAHHLMTTYGLSADEYAAMSEAQGGRCALCDREPDGQVRGGRWLHVDHCHRTGRVRGLLCVSCNSVLGRIERLGLERVSAYLARD